MGKELRDHLDIIVDDASHPLKRHEHDEFAQIVFRAEQKLEKNGITGQLQNLLTEKQLLSMTSADGVWEGGASADRANTVLVERLGKLDEQIVKLAKQQRIKPDVCEALGIKIG